MKRLIVGLGLLLALAAPVSAQPTFPEAGMRAINGLYAGVNPQDDDARRVAIQRVCEQMQFDLGEQWGNKKRAGLPDTFRSPDSIAWQEAEGQPVSVWDVQASSGQILVFAGKPADHPNLPVDEAAFMDCTATNHLGTTPPPDPEPEPGDDHDAIWAAIEQTQAVLTALIARVDQLEQALANVLQRTSALEARPVVVGCRASVFGIGISCSLVTQ